MISDHHTKLVLASGSPRRKQLLAQLDIEFDVLEADIDEQAHENEHPGDMTLRLAETKAKHVYQKLGVGHRVLGGDTTVALCNLTKDANTENSKFSILGKPRNRVEAYKMLSQLSGKTHLVFSAVALMDASGCQSRVSETRVIFRKLDPSEISAYCDSEDPYDKAGGYGIQGLAGNFVTDLQGSYTGVIGLPLWHVHQLLFGVS